MKTSAVQFLTKDNQDNYFFTVLGKKDGKITVSVSKDSGLESLSFVIPKELKSVKVGDTVTVTVEGDKLSYKSSTPTKSGTQEKSTTPNVSERISM